MQKIHEKIKESEKILVFAYYFFLDKDAYVEFKTTLLFLKKLNKNFNFLSKTTNAIFLDSLHEYVKTAIKSMQDAKITDSRKLKRAFNANIKINKNIFFNIAEYVSASGKIFNIKFCMFGKEFTGYREMFNLLNLTDFIIKHKVFNPIIDREVKKRLTKALAINISNKELFNAIKKAKEEKETEIPF